MAHHLDEFVERVRAQIAHTRNAVDETRIYLAESMRRIATPPPAERHGEGEVADEDELDAMLKQPRKPAIRKTGKRSGRDASRGRARKG